PCGHVPGLQSLFPESVEPAAGNIGEIECRGSIATHALRVQDEVRKVSREFTALAYVVGKACAQQRPRQRVDRRDMNAATVKRRALSTLRSEQFIAHWIVDHTDFHAPFVLESDGDTETRIAVGIVRSAVERINNP